MAKRTSELKRAGEHALSATARWADRVATSCETFALNFRDPARLRSDYSPRDPVVRRRLVQNTLMGFLGSGLVLLGASLPASPFTEKVPPPPTGPYTPAWFFGAVSSPPLATHLRQPTGLGFYLSLIGFYGGVVLLARAWIRIARLVREHPGFPLRLLAIVLVVWIVPMLLVAPLLSKDAYDYVAQGEMMSRHINPYSYGPAVLGGGANSYTDLTDPLWWYTTSPYGPGFLGLAFGIQLMVGHSELWALVAWRFVALLGVGLIAVFLPRLVRSFGKDPGPAFVLGVMNPIVIIQLVGGEHNDALMLGLLIAGVALARERHFVLAAAVVGAAALVKVPALLGIVYVAWEWAGPVERWRPRFTSLAKASAVAVAVMAAATEALGIGWGWIGGLGAPDAIRSYLDPMTAVGLGLADLASALGDHGLQHTLLTVARGVGAVAVVAIGFVLFSKARDGADALRAFGVTMLLVVVLGPVMQPWYLAWGLVLLAPLAEGRLRGVLIWLTIAVNVLALGDVQNMLGGFKTANPLIVAVASLGMLALLLEPVLPKLRQGLGALRAARIGEPSELSIPLPAPEELPA